MNCLLAAAPTLTLRTYTICTALSLFKVIIHTGLGASIHSFKDYHNPNVVQEDSSNQQYAQYWTVGGIVLCVAIMVYLSVVARRAVEEELDHSTSPTRRTAAARDEEERVGFLSPMGQEEDDEDEMMVESPLMHSRPSISV